MDIAVKLMDTEDRIARYIEDNPLEVYVDYRDELSDKQMEQVLAGNSDEVRCDIEMNYDTYSEGEELSYYKDEMSTALDISIEDIDRWFDGPDSFYPGYNLDDHDWSRLLRNSKTYITATVEEACWNFNNWAYGYPLEYGDVKEALKLLNVNPKEFRDLATGGSMTSGPGKVKGYFPNMPQREAAVDIKDLYDNMCSLYDGQMSFCLADLEEAAEVGSSDSKNIVFKKGTNVVMYNFGCGAGITEVELIKDVTIPRKMVDIDLDSSYAYGIQDCYGFTHDYWEKGGIQNGK